MPLQKSKRDGLVEREKKKKKKKRSEQGQGKHKVSTSEVLTGRGLAI